MIDQTRQQATRIEELERQVAVARALLKALKEIDIIVNESRAECRKRVGTRLGNIMVTARAAIAIANGLEE